MTTFIKLDPYQYDCKYRGCGRGHGYYEASKSNGHSYRHISNQFNMKITFFNPSLYESRVVYFSVLTTHFFITISFSLDLIELKIFDREDYYKNRIFHQTSNELIKLELINEIINYYTNIYKNMPSLDDIMLFLDSIPIEYIDKVSLVKNIFINKNENIVGICDWKSGFELLINYSTPLFLPMVII